MRLCFPKGCCLIDWLDRRESFLQQQGSITDRPRPVQWVLEENVEGWQRVSDKEYYVFHFQLCFQFSFQDSHSALPRPRLSAGLPGTRLGCKWCATLKWGARLWAQFYPLRLSSQRQWEKANLRQTLLWLSPQTAIYCFLSFSAYLLGYY